MQFKIASQSYLKPVVLRINPQEALTLKKGVQHLSLLCNIAKLLLIWILFIH